jgi:hypothetical protein
VRAATRKIEMAIMNGHSLARSPRAVTIASSLFAMNVSAIQAMPNNAIIATIPDRNIGMPGTSPAFTLQVRRMSAAALSMTIWMIGVTARGSVPPSSLATTGRMSSMNPKMQMRSTPRRNIATLRFAYCLIWMSAADSGSLTSPASRRRLYSGSSIRSLPCRLITTDIAMIPRRVAGIVINRMSTRSRPSGSTSGSIVAMAAATGLDVMPIADATVELESGRSGRILFAYETSLITGTIE